MTLNSFCIQHADLKEQLNDVIQSNLCKTTTLGTTQKWSSRAVVIL